MSKTKFLIFDTDASLSSIGNDEEVELVFGYPPIHLLEGVDQLMPYLYQLFVRTTQVREHPLFGRIEEYRFLPNDHCKAAGIGGLMIDTLSTLGSQTRSLIKATKEAMDKRDWGIYGEKMQELLEIISKLDLPVVITSHIELKEDQIQGRIMQMPLIKGSTANDIGRYFDAVLYLDITRDLQTGERIYRMLTQPTADRFAKNRKGILQEYEPTLGNVLAKYFRAGLRYPKILICGTNGSGKTTMLSTYRTLVRPATLPTYQPNQTEAA